DNKIDVVYENKPLKEVDVLSIEPRGMTALLDAVGITIVKLGESLSAIPEQDRPARVIFVVVTDGLENSSREYTKDKVKEMVKHQDEVYNWTFIFLGANQDAVFSGGEWGISKG